MDATSEQFAVARIEQRFKNSVEEVRGIVDELWVLGRKEEHEQLAQLLFALDLQRLSWQAQLGAVR